MSNYRRRIADVMLENQLEVAGAVLIQGPKWCGKTTTAANMASSCLYMDDPENIANNLLLADTNAKLLLAGATPRLIDELQIAPKLWDAARFEIDHRHERGQFIFTGSAVPVDISKINHSGTGRFAWLTMRPMSLWESGESNGAVSIEKLFENEMQDAPSLPYNLEEIAYLICRGGWPEAVNQTPADKSEETYERKRKNSLRHSVNYLNGVIYSDLSRVDNVVRDAQLTANLLRVLARHQGGQVPISTIKKDLFHGENVVVSDDTIGNYISALKKIFVEEDMLAWNPNIRSKTAIRTSDTRYFVDPSIATAALGIGPKDLLTDLNTLGLLFETMVVRDLRVYLDAIDGKVYHYRDKNGLECDAVAHLPNGHYGLIEIKLGGETLVEEGVKTLQKLSKTIDTTKMYAPSFMMIVTAVGQYAYKRKDGIIIAPIGSLKN